VKPLFKDAEAALRQRQLELRLRSAELRAELDADLADLRRPLRWAGVLASLAGTLAMGLSLRRPGLAGRGLVFTELALRVLRVARRWFGRGAGP